MKRRINLRSAAERDELFLYELYKASRAEEFAVARLTDMQFDQLMRMQYAARKATYDSNYPHAQHDVIVVDGAEAGQIWVSREPTQFRVVDIGIAASFQNQGIGAFLMTQLMEEANQAGVPVRCSVATNNPGSLRFHQRLGFRITSQNEMYIELERDGAAAGPLSQSAAPAS